MAERRVTRQDVADRAGVSTAVVSYVLNDGPRPVAEATRQRVLDAIEQTGYRVNFHARALAGGRTDVVGLVVPDITNAFFAEIAAKMQLELHRVGATLLLGNSSDNEEDELSVVSAMLERDVDTLVLIGVSDGIEAELRKRSAGSFIFLDRVPADSRIASVTIDNRSAAREATEHLIAHGRRRIALVGGPTGLAVADDRERGYRDGLAAARFTAEPVTVRAEFSKAGGHAALHELVAATEGIDALLIASEEQALGAISAAATLGLAIPDDLALIAFDGTRSARYSVPSLSTITQPVGQMVTKVLQTLREPPGATRAEMCRHVFHPRRSCGCPEDGAPQQRDGNTHQLDGETA